jgi:hypothetical protein
MTTAGTRRWIAETNRLIGRDPESIAEWSGRHAQSTAIHEAAHALVGYVLGGTIASIAIGPGQSKADRESGSMGQVHFALMPIDACVCVLLAGELAEACSEQRAPNFEAAASDWEVIKDVDRVTIDAAIKRVESILDKNSVALFCLAMRLQRWPFRVEAAEFESLMEKVTKRG